MPTLDINGRKVQVGDEFMQLSPEEQDATVDEIAQGMEPQVGVGEDMLRSGMAGLGQGAVGLAGLPGDLTHMDPISHLLGTTVSPDQRAEMERLGLIPKEGSGFNLELPTSAELQQKANDATRPAPNVSGMVTGQQPQSFMEYEPQTWQGDVANRGGRLLPGVAMGPGGMVVKGGQLAGGTAGGEIGQRVGKELGHELAGDVIGTMAGIGIPTLAGRAPGAKVPTTQDFQAAKNNAYAKAEAAGNTLPAMDYYQTVDDLKQIATKRGAGTGLTPKVDRALKALEKRVTSKDLSVAEIDQYRQILKMGEDIMKPQERALIRRLVHEYDKRVDVAVPPELKEARRLNVRYKKSELMDEMRDAAELKTGQYSQSGSENATRTMFRQLAMNKRKMRQFDSAEREAIRKVAKGTRPANAARWLGKFAPTSVVSSLPAILMGGGVGAANPMLGGIVGAGIAGVGMAGKVASNVLTSKSARIAEELVRAGKGGAAAARAVRGDKRLEALARALIAGNATANRPVE